VTTPHTKEEQRLRKLGHQYIAGLDEVGKGSWAGPLVAAAVILPLDFNAKGIRDSKQLTPKAREKLFVRIINEATAWAVHVVEHFDIDLRGIQNANTTALINSAKKLHIPPDALLVDAVQIRFGRSPVKSIIKGDQKSVSIAAASIIAKVIRDELMNGHHRLYPQYGFHKHKGYGTAEHFAAIEKHGVSPIHRRTFRPMNGKPKAASKAKAKAKR
jgi:ribonuclease HII